MNKQLLSLCILLLPLAGICQVAVGTNNVHPSAEFQIESNNRGFLQSRIALTGTTDIVTIANPATGLMVYNTATAGSGATAITPGVYYFDGTRWVRMDATQASATPSNPTVFVGGQFLNPNFYNRSILFDATYGDYSTALKLAAITLPAGKWEVNVANNCEVYNWNYFVPTFNNYTGNNSTNNSTGTPIKMMYWLQTDSVTLQMNVPGGDIFGASYGTYPPVGGGDTLFSNSASFVQPIQNSTPYHTGTFYINNTSGVDQTYYLFAMEQSKLSGAFTTNRKMPTYSSDFAKRSAVFNRIYAKLIY